MQRLSKSELTVVLWQNLPEYARFALMHDGVDWPTWRRADTPARWQMLKRAIGN
jgi:hypothetical protein